MSSQRSPKQNAKEKLLWAALRVIRSRGYAATTVDELCEAAGVTKGGFFHHFASKEDLAVAAAQFWSDTTTELFAKASYHQPSDPLDRLLAYVEFRKDLLKGTTPEFTCLVGTMVQETFHTSPAIREACQASIFGHAASLENDIEEAKKLYAPKAAFTAKSLALHFQAVIQGAFILAKAKDDAHYAAESLDHLRRYLEQTFPRPKKQEKA